MAITDEEYLASFSPDVIAEAEKAAVMYKDQGVTRDQVYNVLYKAFNIPELDQFDDLGERMRQAMRVVEGQLSDKFDAHGNDVQQAQQDKTGDVLAAEPNNVVDQGEQPDEEKLAEIQEQKEQEQKEQEQKKSEKTLPASAVGYVEYKKDLNKIDFAGLPNYNVMYLWNSHFASPYVYPELVVQNAIMWLCAISMKRVEAITEDIFGKEFDDPLYTILYALGLAPTASCKTTLFRTAQKSLKHVIGNDNFAPNAPSPETLLKNLSESIIETKMNRDTGLMERQEFRYDGMKYPNSWKNMWDEEAGGFFGKFKKTYMAGIQPAMCSIFSGEFPNKGNSGEKQGTLYDYIADDPFLSVNLYTVPENMKLLDSDSSDNGYILRHIITLANYDIPLPPKTDVSYDGIGMLDFDDSYVTDQGKEMRLQALDNAGKIIDVLLDMGKRKNKKLRIKIHPQALQIIKNWEITMREQYKGNPQVKKMRSRHFENAYKIAMLLELGNVPYHIVSHTGIFESKDTRIEGTYTDVSNVDALFEQLANYDLKLLNSVRLETFTVSPQTMEFTLKMFDRIYLPHAMEACKMLFAGDDVDMEKVYDILDNAKRISKDDLLERKDDILNAISDSFADKYEKADNIKDKDERALYKKQLDRAVKSKCDETLETIEELPVDSVITTIARKPLTKKFRGTASKLDPVLDTLEGCGVLFKYSMKIEGSKKPTTVYIYLKDNTTELVLPEFNYENYIGTGKYDTGVKLYREPVGLASCAVQQPTITSEPVDSQIQAIMANTIEPENKPKFDW